MVKLGKRASKIAKAVTASSFLLMSILYIVLLWNENIKLSKELTNILFTINIYNMLSCIVVLNTDLGRTITMVFSNLAMAVFILIANSYFGWNVGILNFITSSLAGVMLSTVYVRFLIQINKNE